MIPYWSSLAILLKIKPDIYNPLKWRCKIDHVTNQLFDRFIILRLWRIRMKYKLSHYSHLEWINKHQFSFKLVLTIYKYPNRIFLKTEEKPLHWKSNLHRWGIKPSPSVVMVNLRALKYSMSFAKRIDFIAFCFLGRLYCYTWRVRALHSIHPSPADESIQIIDDTSCFIYCTISVAYYFKFFNLESILMWSNDSCSL